MSTEETNTTTTTAPEETKNIFGAPNADNKNIFGAAPVFGAPTPAAAPAAQGEEDVEAGADDKHAADFAPLISLPKVEVKTEEEDEEIVFKSRSKIYSFVAEDVYGGEKRTNYWKERGTGDLKLLKHKEHGKVRLLMRQEKTLKICANHLVSPEVELEANVGSDRSWVFPANDFADGEVKAETFAVKFKTAEIANEFKDKMEEAKKINGGDETETVEKEEQPTKEESAEGDKLADAVDKLKVEGEAEKAEA